MFSIQEFKSNKSYLEQVCGANPTKWEQWRNFYKSHLQSLNKKKYIYLLTFTICPTKTPNHKEIEQTIEDYVITQMKRKPLQIISAHIVKEYTKSNVAHWHLSVESLKPLKKDRFNYYILKYGFVDLSRTKAQTMQEAINYMSKESLPTKIV